MCTLAVCWYETSCAASPTSTQTLSLEVTKCQKIAQTQRQTEQSSLGSKNYQMAAKLQIQ